MSPDAAFDVTVTLDAAALTQAVLARAADVSWRPAPKGEPAAAGAAARAELSSAPTSSAPVPRWLRGGCWAFDLGAVDLYASLDDAGAIAALDRRPDPTALSAAIDTRGIAILPIHGFITRRSTFWSQLFGGTALSEVEDAMRAAVADSTIKAIVLDVDSPGGSVTGVHETFEIIRAANAVKPVHAAISGLGASAAYWLASAASTIAVSPSAEVGSIGVFGMHADRSAYFASRGVTFSVFAVPTAKAEATDVVPLTDDAREAMRARVAGHYARFVGDVAAGRGVSVDAVRAGYGGGRVVGSEDALTSGLVDRIETPTAVLSRVADDLADRDRQLAIARFRGAVPSATR